MQDKSSHSNDTLSLALSYKYLPFILHWILLIKLFISAKGIGLVVVSHWEKGMHTT